MPRRRGRRRVGHRGPGGRRCASSICWSSRTDTTGTRGCPTSPAPSPANHSTPTTTSTRRHPLDLDGQAHPGRRPRATAPPTSPSNCRRRRCRTQVTLSTRSSAWIVPKYIAGRPGDTLWRTTPYLPLSWQRKAIQLFAPVMGVDPTMYGLPAPNHKLFEAHPTQSVELPLRLGSGDVIPEAERRPPRRRHGALRRRHQRRLRRHHLRHRLQHHVPVLRSRLHQRSGQPDPAVQADVQARPLRPRVHRLRPVGAHAVPVRRMPVATAGRLRGRAATRCRRPPRWNASSTPTSSSTPGTAPTVRATPSRSTTSTTNTICARARSLPASSGRQRGDRTAGAL